MKLETPTNLQACRNRRQLRAYDRARVKALAHAIENGAFRPVDYNIDLRTVAEKGVSGHKAALESKAHKGFVEQRTQEARRKAKIDRQDVALAVLAICQGKETLRIGKKGKVKQKPIVITFEEPEVRVFGSSPFIGERPDFDDLPVNEQFPAVQFTRSADVLERDTDKLRAMEVMFAKL